MSGDSTNESGRNFQIGRRQYIVTLGAGLSAALAGCSGDSDDESGPEETDTSEAETEQQSSVCSGDTFDCTEEFANVVLSELEESGDTPEPINAGVYETPEGEGVDDEAMLFAAFDLTNENTLGTQIGNMVFGPMYENWSDYPETSTFHFGVFPTTDGEDRRTTMRVEKWWLDGVDDGEFTTDEVGEMIVDTSTSPLSGVLN